MSPLDSLLVVVAGIGAGTINTIVGSGTLITFPTLLLLGVPPVTANMSNNIGLVPGSITASLGYRSELHGAAPALRRLAPLSLLGGITGAVLLLVLDPAAFRAIVPVLIAVGILLVVLGPRLAPKAAGHGGAGAVDLPPGREWLVQAGVFAAGVYGGYFGAAQGVILMGLLGALSSAPLQRLNGFKNVLASIVNAVAAVAFMLLAWDRIDWTIVALIAVGSTIGGILGARLGRRIPSNVLRAVIVVVGVIALARILTT